MLGSPAASKPEAVPRGPDTSHEDELLTILDRFSRRLVALILLGGFLYQTADGLMATLCHISAPGPAAPETIADRSALEGPVPGESAHTGHEPSDPDASSEGLVDHASQEHDGCPFGSGVLAGCGIAISVAAPSASVQAPLPLVRSSDPSSFASPSGTLLSERPFQPPRA